MRSEFLKAVTMMVHFYPEDGDKTSSETFVTLYQITKSQISEDSNPSFVSLVNLLNLRITLRKGLHKFYIQANFCFL